MHTGQRRRPHRHIAHSAPPAPSSSRRAELRTALKLCLRIIRAQICGDTRVDYGIINGGGRPVVTDIPQPQPSEELEIHIQAQGGVL